MSNINKGDTVDILIKGAEVTWVEEQRTGASQVGFYHSGAYQPARAHVYTGSDDIEVTVLEPPAPEWQKGDTILVDSGKPYSFTLIRLNDGGWACSSEGRGAVPHDHDDQQVNRLVKAGAVVLIREGKLVNP